MLRTEYYAKLTVKYGDLTPILLEVTPCGLTQVVTSDINRSVVINDRVAIFFDIEGSDPLSVIEIAFK